MVIPAFGSDTPLCCAGIACYVVALLIARLALEFHMSERLPPARTSRVPGKQRGVRARTIGR